MSKVSAIALQVGGPTRMTCAAPSPVPAATPHMMAHAAKAERDIWFRMPPSIPESMDLGSGEAGDWPHPGHPDQGPCILVLDLRVRHVEPGHWVSAGVDSGPFGPALLDDGRRRFAAAVWVGSPSRAGPLVRGAAVPNPDPPNHAL